MYFLGHDRNAWSATVLPTTHLSGDLFTSCTCVCIQIISCFPTRRCWVRTTVVVHSYVQITIDKKRKKEKENEIRMIIEPKQMSSV